MIGAVMALNDSATNWEDFRNGAVPGGDGRFYGVEGELRMKNIGLDTDGKQYWTHIVLLDDWISPTPRFVEVGIIVFRNAGVTMARVYWSYIDDRTGNGVDKWGDFVSYDTYYTFRIEYAGNDQWKVYKNSALQDTITFQYTHMRPRKCYSQLEANFATFPSMSTGTEVYRWRNLVWRDQAGSWYTWSSSTIGYPQPFTNVRFYKISDKEYYSYYYA